MDVNEKLGDLCFGCVCRAMAIRQGYSDLRGFRPIVNEKEKS
jgi:hypothetical protein